MPIRAKDYTSVALVNVSAAVQLIAGFEVSINCRFWVSTEVEDTRDVVGKYHAMLTLRTIADWEPQPTYDTFEAFKKPWITDAASVAKKLQE